MKDIPIKNYINIVISTFILLIFISCTSLSPYKVPILQGNIIDEDDISKLKEGLTKEQIQFIFGTAIIKDPFHSSRWDYYYSIQIGDNLIENKKLTIFFNADSLVESWISEEL
tara:strand:+ start:473 stop:811 length:339 start_codon:yes stop_codon:yes gene_type:complete